MTDTVVSSASKEVVIGFERPFVIIGERINPTGRKRLAAQMAVGDYSQVEADAQAQVAAGAHMLDVNAGIPLADEPRILAETIQLVQSLTDVPLSIDSSIVAALEAGLAVYRGKPLVNSVTGEEERLEAVLPLVKRYGAAVVAISNDETGISEDPDVRFAVAKKIVEHAADYGIGREDIVVDPLIMPIGALGTAGRAAFHLIRRLREELRVNTTCGASNVSFGLPNRHGLNAAFLSMAIGAGMTSAITNPLHAEEMTGIMGADVRLDPGGFDIGIRPSWEQALADVEERGGTPYAIPAGASDHPLGGLGFARWAGEVAEQERELGLFFDTIVVCAVTGSTHAGMIAGFAAQEAERRVLGIDASATVEKTRGQIARIAGQTAEKVGVGRDLRDDEIVLLDEWHAGTYGIPDEKTIEAIRLCARLEGVITDPVYEGKSMAALVDLVRDGRIEPGSRVLYAHLGGQPALNAYAGAFSPGSQPLR